MSRLTRKIINNKDEVVIDVIRRSLWSFFWKIIVAVVLINLPFFLIYPLFQYGIWGVVLFSVVLVVALIFILRIYLAYYYTALLITSKRLIDVDQSGFFNRSVITIVYSKIQDVNSLSRGLFNNILRVGDIHITFINDKRSVVELDSIKYPNLVVEKIIQQREYYLREGRGISEKKAIKILNKIRKKLGPVKYSELISD